ncbi:MAG TPA: arginase family protein [Frankiaceae bacterium]|nr:arginase family protein [Frankiaceae bacterium]
MQTRSEDPRWPRAATWLQAGPGTGDVDLAVLGVPTFRTSISGSGAHATPQAVRRVLHRLSTWCPTRGVDVADVLAPLDFGNVDDPDFGDEGEWRVRTMAMSAAKMAPLVFAIGGDNALTAPFGQGVLPDLGAGGLVTLDAHHDIREGRSNGSPVRRLLDAGLPGERVVQVGIADWANSRSYADEAHARGVTAVYRSEVATRGIADVMRHAIAVAGAGGGGVLVDLDLDVCDRSVAPGCPASLPGGLSANDALTAACEAGRDPRVKAIDVTEVDATNDPDERTVRLAALCLLEAAAGLAVRLGRAPGTPQR